MCAGRVAIAAGFSVDGDYLETLDIFFKSHTHAHTRGNRDLDRGEINITLERYFHLQSGPFSPIESKSRKRGEKLK